MTDIKIVRDFYSKNSLELNDENIDLELFSLFLDNPQKEIDDFVLDAIKKGSLIDEASVKFNYDDSVKTNFALIQNKGDEIGVAVILQILDCDKFKIVSVFPFAEITGNNLGGCYYPDFVEVFGRIKSAVGDSNADFFDFLLLFERYFYEDEDYDDVDWMIYGFAFGDNDLERYNDFDCIGDKIKAFRKMKIDTTEITQIKYGKRTFYKCYAEGSDFYEYSKTAPAEYEIKAPIYISDTIIKSVEELYDGKEMNVLMLGNIKRK